MYEQLKWIEGHPVVLHRGGFELGKLPHAQLPERTLYLSRTYLGAPKNFEATTINGHYRGRTLELLLEKPLLVAGSSYALVSVKGTGGIGVGGGLRIHPHLWHVDGDPVSYWQERGNHEERLWGAVMTSAGKAEERMAKLLVREGIEMVPHLAVNEIPPSIVRNIWKIELRSSELPYCTTRVLPKKITYTNLCQVVRTMHTNIRVTDYFAFCERWPLIRKYVEPERFASIDSSSWTALQRLMKKGKTFMVNGVIADNRLLDGMHIDAENWEVTLDLPEDERKRQRRSAWCFVHNYFKLGTQWMVPAKIFKKYAISLFKTIDERLPSDISPIGVANQLWEILQSSQNRPCQAIEEFE